MVIYQNLLANTKKQHKPLHMSTQINTKIKTIFLFNKGNFGRDIKLHIKFRRFKFLVALIKILVAFSIILACNFRQLPLLWWWYGLGMMMRLEVGALA